MGSATVGDAAGAAWPAQIGSCALNTTRESGPANQRLVTAA
jgi:hypothetical protein